MLTVEQIITYIEETLAQDALSGDKDELRRTQYACGVLMRAADKNGDKTLSARFRSLAAKAANYRDEEKD